MTYDGQRPLIHCNDEVLHAPGVCDYCDAYPDRQAARAASGGGFTPAQANGWYGNVAQRKASVTDTAPAENLMLDLATGQWVPATPVETPSFAYPPILRLSRRLHRLWSRK